MKTLTFGSHSMNCQYSAFWPTKWKFHVTQTKICLRGLLWGFGEVNIRSCCYIGLSINIRFTFLYENAFHITFNRWFLDKIITEGNQFLCMNMRSVLHILTLTITLLSSDFFHLGYRNLFQCIHNLGEFWLFLFVVVLLWFYID